MSAPAPPEVVDAALLALADGQSQAAAAAVAGVSQPTVSKWASRFRERREKLGEMLHFRWLRRTFRGMDGIHDALGRVVLDERLDEKGRPLTRGSDKAQAANVILSHAMPAGPESLTMIGCDVDASVNVQVDARRVQLIQGASGSELDSHLSDLSRDLGLA